MSKERFRKLAFTILGLLMLSLTSCLPGCPLQCTPVEKRFPTTGWPIESTDVEHEIGNSAGEFQQYIGNPYFHGGIDILDDSAPNGPWVRVVREGSPTLTTYGASSLYNGLTMTHANGEEYLYWHLDYNSITQEVSDADNDGTTLAANSSVSRLVEWTSCDFHHLHYEISDNSGVMDPIYTLDPRKDTTDPVIENVFFVQNATNNEFTTDSSGTPNLSGDVDIIVQCYDTQFGTARTGVMRLTYQVTDLSGNVVKELIAIRFRDIPSDANSVNDIYRNSSPFDSNSNYCGTEEYYYVPTNVDATGNITTDVSGSWDTTVLENGAYEVHVGAQDAWGNAVKLISQVNIDN